MTVTCPYCKKKFHKGKTSEFGRMSKHIWKEHKDKQRAKIKKGQRAKTKQLDEEFQYTDDILVQSLLNAGIPLSPPMQQQVPYPNQPVQHESLTGAILTGIKIGQAIASGVAVAKTVKKSLPKRKAKK
ncbi:unnamed protein product [marine sediment metagenome]|uniref:Uncharacterized protein n=1 Tax=marine sediment metagenome TaxID=412755 RepID=X0ZTD2_9ZZZZ